MADTERMNPTPPGMISESSRRIARNTLLLYFRMFLMLAIGLFTSRIVLRALGESDFGVWDAVGGVVTMFTVISTSIATAISRFVSFELGKEDKDRLHKVFSTSILIQILLCIALVILTETLGLWYLHSRMQIPAGRMGAAEMVLQCSLGILVITLLSVPYNAVIIAHEKMKAFAYISILEAVLKLSVALLLYFSASDKLKLYALLMLAVSFIVRMTYAAFCHRHFEETRGRKVFDRGLLKEMSGFAVWNFFGSGAYVINTQGVNQLVNIFFGVAMNAARGITSQVEKILRQFVTNFTTALNPAITKSYAAGKLDYTFELVCKGAKYSYLMLYFLALPIFLEADKLLQLWLGTPPAESATFVRLMLLGTIADMLGNSMAYLEMATGDIKKYYLIVGGVSMLVFPLSWIAFRLGMPASTSYVIFAIIYLLLVGVKLLILRAQIGFPIRKFAHDVLLKITLATVPSLLLTVLVWWSMEEGIARLLVTLLVSCVSVAASTYLLALTPGEKAFVNEKVKKIFTK